MSKKKAQSAADQLMADVEAAEPAFDQILEGTVDDVQAYIATVESIDTLRDLADAEQAGKNRKGVLTSIGPRIQELVPPEPVEPQVQSEPTPEPEPEQPADFQAPSLSQDGGSQEAASEVPPTYPTVASMAYPFEGDSWEGEMGRYVAIKHMTRIMNPLGGLDDRIKTPIEVNEEIEDDWFAEGYELLKIVPMGFDQTGLAVLYVLGKVRDDLAPRHTQIWHIQRTLVERDQRSDSITAFQADQYVSSFLKDGWNLFASEVIQRGADAIPMLWIVVR